LWMGLKLNKIRNPESLTRCFRKKPERESLSRSGF
jgi:hypothetical protein